MKLQSERTYASDPGVWFGVHPGTWGPTDTGSSCSRSASPPWSVASGQSSAGSSLKHVISYALWPLLTFQLNDPPKFGPGNFGPKKIFKIFVTIFLGHLLQNVNGKKFFSNSKKAFKIKMQSKEILPYKNKMYIKLLKTKFMDWQENECFVHYFIFF